MYDESVGARMSWASKRKTKRKEDMAYCLLGIFDINMPLIYGEGSKAFRRLQEEIIKRNNDLTIFAWDLIHGSGRWDDIVGVFADSPLAFASSHHLRNVFEGLGPEFSVTNRGLLLSGDFRLRFQSSGLKASKSTYVLEVKSENRPATRVIALRKLAPRLFGRLRSYPWLGDPSNYHNHIETISVDADTIYILTDFHHIDDIDVRSTSRSNALHVPKQKHLEFVRASPQLLWDHFDAVFLQPRKDIPSPFYSSVIAVEFRFPRAGNEYSIIVVYRSDFIRPRLHVLRSDEKGIRNLLGLFEYHPAATGKEVQWNDLIRDAPWVLERGDSIELRLWPRTYSIKFFVEPGKLDTSNIPVTNLQSHVTFTEDRTGNTVG
jgi:hypothetical protein